MKGRHDSPWHYPIVIGLVFKWNLALMGFRFVNSAKASFEICICYYHQLVCKIQIQMVQINMSGVQRYDSSPHHYRRVLVFVARNSIILWCEVSLLCATYCYGNLGYFWQPQLNSSSATVVEVTIPFLSIIWLHLCFSCCVSDTLVMI